jgi:hypothetical protein
VSGTVSSGNNFGNYLPGVISGYKFNDLNGNGLMEEGEARMAGWTIRLFKDGVFVAETTTMADNPDTTDVDETGMFVFTGLLPGTYELVEVGKDGWTMTAAPGPVEVVSGTVSSGNYFGNFRLGGICGYKFEDLNHNGVKEVNEPYMSGISIWLDENGNGTWDDGERRTETDMFGFYCFNNLGPGSYTVHEVEPDGYTRTTLAPPTIFLESGDVYMAYEGEVPVGEAQMAIVMEELAIGNHKPCQGSVYTQGYWKNHADVWPVTSLTLGTVTYTQAQLLRIFDEPVGTGDGANGLISLAHQLIAAKLNIANGACPTNIQATIDEADALINGLVVPPIGSGYLTPAETSALTAMLDLFNNGLLGPPPG